MIGNNLVGYIDYMGLETVDGIDMEVLRGDLNIDGDFPIQSLTLPESACGTCTKKDSPQVIPPGDIIPNSVDVYRELHGKFWPEFGGGTVFNIPSDLGCVELDPVQNKFYSRKLINPALTGGERLSEDDDHRKLATREEIHWFFAAQLKATIDANVKNQTDKTLTMMLAAGSLRANSDLIALNTTREMTIGQATATVLGVTFASIKAREIYKKMHTPKQSVGEILQGLPKGKQKHVRTVSSERDLNELYTSMTEGAETVSSGAYPGVVKKLPDGTVVRIRPLSKSGGATIDVSLPDGTLLKVHVE